jgi:methyl-accepting chemotaxis protein
MKRSITISTRILVACGILIAALVIQAGVALYGFSNVRSYIVASTTTAVPGMVAAGAMTQDLYRLRANVMRHILTVDPQDMAKREQDHANLLLEIHADSQKLAQSLHDDEDRQTLATVNSLISDYAAEAQGVFAVSRTGRKTEAAALYTKTSKQTIAGLNAVVPRLHARKTAQQVATSDAMNAIASRSFWSMLIICGLSTLAGVLVSFVMIRSTNRQLRDTTADLDEAATQIASAAEQAELSSQSGAQASSEQAATIEETSAAASEINSMAQRNTENSRATAEMVTQSQERFDQTNQSLEQMVEAMDGITTSSHKISKIIKVIDEIAFQTNILALNAAVEAARAGEAGMGFAVVADEVRNLAQRCAQAAQDTAALIEESIERSSGGKVKVDHVAQSIRTITADSAKMKVLVDEISHGSIEQARGIEQITRSIAQLEQVTQISAANAEVGAGSAQKLSIQAKAMRQGVDRLNQMIDGSAKAKALPRLEQKPAPKTKPMPKTKPVPTKPMARPAPKVQVADGPTTIATFKSAIVFPAARPATPVPVKTVQSNEFEFPMDDDFKEF